MTRKRSTVPVELPVNAVSTERCDDYTRKVVVLRRSALKEPYASQDRRLLVTGGFGAKAHLMGNAVYGIALLDGEDDARWNRSDIAGLAVDQTLTDVATNKLKEIAG